MMWQDGRWRLGGGFGTLLNETAREAPRTDRVRHPFALLFEEGSCLDPTSQESSPKNRRMRSTN